MCVCVCVCVCACVRACVRVCVFSISVIILSPVHAVNSSFSRHVGPRGQTRIKALFVSVVCRSVFF